MIASLAIVSFTITVSTVAISSLRSSVVLSDRIVGGENANIESYPYQISVAYYGSHICGGSIVSRRLVLTAAHCAEDFARHLTIRSGSSFRDSGKETKVQKIIRHEKYGSNRYGNPVNDIALLLLVESVIFDETQQPIGLFNQGEEASTGLQAVITGWGVTRPGASSLPSQLQVVTIPIISKSLCREAYRLSGGLPNNQICAAYYRMGGRDSCQGDSGGPLVINGRQAGIVSWGNGCAESYYPGVYTEVAAYRSWIDEKIDRYGNTDELVHS